MGYGACCVHEFGHIGVGLDVGVLLGVGVWLGVLVGQLPAVRVYLICSPVLTGGRVPPVVSHPTEVADLIATAADAVGA